MKINQTALILIVSIFCLTVFFPNQTAAQTRRQVQLMTTEAERISGDEFEFETETANGAHVFAMRKPSRQMLAAIDQGLTDLFAVARKNNYRNNLNYADYTIFIARADRVKDVNGNYSPDIAVSAAQYAGSVYDKGGYIYAAGMVTTFNPAAFLIAEHEKQLNRVSEVVRYEGEHLILYHNDRRKFEKTRDHSKGGGHPILQ